MKRFISAFIVLSIIFKANVFHIHYKYTGTCIEYVNNYSSNKISEQTYIYFMSFLHVGQAYMFLT